MTGPEYAAHIEGLDQSVQATAEALAPGLTLYGLSTPAYVPIDPEKYAAVRIDRLKAEQEREGNEDLARWSFTEGIYWGKSWDHSLPISRHPLNGISTSIAHDIDTLLADRSGDRPVVALDFGGGQGMAWLRIASQPTYRAAIESGRLAMVVTNLGSTPNPLPDWDGLSGIARSMNFSNRIDTTFYKQEELEWAQAHEAYVHYIDSNALELGRQSLELTDGTILPLNKNVDIIHENLSLTHSHVADLALASFGQLLSNHGTLYSDAAQAYHMVQGSSHRTITTESGETIQLTEDYEDQRRIALIVGSQLLQQTFAYSVSDSNHRGIFTRRTTMRR
jgi:hypothetical protein